MNFNQPKAAAGVSADTTACKNTDREIWRGPDEGSGDFYADSLHITKDGALGINCGGSVYVKPIREWHRLAGGPIDGLRPAGVSKDTLADKLMARANEIDNRLGPIPGRSADAMAVELREAAAALRTLPSSDQCVAREALEKIRDFPYVGEKAAQQMALIAGAALAVPQAAVADEWSVVTAEGDGGALLHKTRGHIASFDHLEDALTILWALAPPPRPGTMTDQRLLEDMTLADNARRVAIRECADIALAIDSGRGNEKEIAKAILALTNPAPTELEGK